MSWLSRLTNVFRPSSVERALDEELAFHIESRIDEVCDAILPGASFDDTVAHLEADPQYVIDGVDAFQRWNQRRIDDTIAALDGTHFDIAPPLRRWLGSNNTKGGYDLYGN